MTLRLSAIGKPNPISLEKVRDLSQRVDACQLLVIERVQFTPYGGLAIDDQGGVKIDIDECIARLGKDDTKQFRALQHGVVSLLTQQVTVYEESNGFHLANPGAAILAERCRDYLTNAIEPDCAEWLPASAERFCRDAQRNPRPDELDS